MLDAHPRFVSMDEQPILQSCIERMKAMGLEYPYSSTSSMPAGMSVIRDVYWAEVGEDRACPARRNNWSTRTR